jgi:hypothetical protein
MVVILIFLRLSFLVVPSYQYCVLDHPVATNFERAVSARTHLRPCRNLPAPHCTFCRSSQERLQAKAQTAANNLPFARTVPTTP